MATDQACGRELVIARNHLVEDLLYLAENASFEAAIKHFTVVVLTGPQDDATFQVMTAQAFESFLRQAALVAQVWAETDYDGVDLP